jgi:oxalate decarboxylase
MFGPPGVLLLPHWHTNSAELGYVIRGTLRGSVVFNGIREVFMLYPGDVFYAPPGFYHFLEKVTPENATILAAFSTNNPDTMDIVDVFSTMKHLFPDVLAKTFNVPVSQVNAMYSVPLGSSRPPFEYPQPSYAFDPRGNSRAAKCFLFRNIDDISKKREPYFPDSTVYWAAAPKVPQLVLESFAHVILEPGAMRSPLRFTNAQEIIFVLSGSVEVGIAGGGGKGGKQTVKQYDVAWTPTGWFSYIYNRGNTPASVLLIYNAANPEATSLLEVYTQTPREVLGTMHHVSPQFFANFARDQDTPNPFRPNVFDSCAPSSRNVRGG